MTDDLVGRQREIDRRVTERFLTEPMQQDAFRNDPQHHAHVKLLRQMLAATERAMEAEGISVETRDRVAYRLLFGEAPESYAEPDFREAHKRMADRQRALSEQMMATAWLVLPDP